MKLLNNINIFRNEIPNKENSPLMFFSQYPTSFRKKTATELRHSFIISNNTFIYLLLSLIGIILISCFHTKLPTEEATIVGHTTWNEWKVKSGWTDFDANNFNPSIDKINKLTKLNNNRFSYVLFAATYCDECREQVPKLFKIFKLAYINEENIKFYGLDDKLQEPSGYYHNYNITSTPKLFIIKNKKIIGSLQYQDNLWLDAMIEVLEKNQS